jgi:predicted dienelactone hydrolase
MKNILALLASLFLITACTDEFEKPKPAVAPKDTPGKYLTDETNFPVGAIPVASLRDPQRNKDVGLVIEYPSQGQGPFPVVLFSHGYGGSNESYIGLTEYWAGHGYVVIKPAHADAGALRELLRQRRREMREERAAANNSNGTAQAQPQPAPRNIVEEAWEAQTTAEWRNRARDLTFILDNFDALEAAYPELKGKIDRNRVAVAGHSYGALLSMLLGGVVPVRDNAPLRLADPRVKAVIALSPQGVSASRGLSAESFRDLRVPTLFMTGTEDRGAGANEDPAWRRTAFENAPAGDKYFVTIEGANNLSFTGLFSDPTAMEDRLDRADQLNAQDPYRQSATMQPRSRAMARFERERNIYTTVKLLSTAFLDAVMKGSPEAREYLDRRLGEKSGFTFEKK